MKSLDTYGSPKSAATRQHGAASASSTPGQATGASMAPVRDIQAGIPSLEADFHDYAPAPPPHRQSGAVAGGFGGSRGKA